jgi:hypothetical protein
MSKTPPVANHKTILFHLETAGGAATLAQTENFFDFLQRKTQRLGLLDKLNPAERCRRIKPVVRAGTIRRRQQAQPFVVMKRLHAHAGVGREFTDLQERFGLHASGKIYGARAAGKARSRFQLRLQVRRWPVRRLPTIAETSPCLGKRFEAG